MSPDALRDVLLAGFPGSHVEVTDLTGTQGSRPSRARGGVVLFDPAIFP